VKLVVGPFDAPGCLGRIGSRRSDPATAIRARRRDNPSFSDWADLPSVMRTKRNISGAARPTIERVDELQNQERSDRGYGGVRKLFVDQQFSMRQQFEFDARRPRQCFHLGARSWGCSIAIDDEHRHVCAPRQVKKGRAAFDAVEGTGDEANGGVTCPRRAGHRQLRG